MPDEKPTRQADPATDGATVTANAAEFRLPNGISMLGIFHVRCDCQPTAALAAPINLKTMTAVCRFCGMAYTVAELSLTANIEIVPATPVGSSQVN